MTGDGFEPCPFFRIVLTDGTTWLETAQLGWAMARLRAVRGNRITDGDMTVGPDAGATLQRLHQRSGFEWRDFDDV